MAWRFVTHLSERESIDYLLHDVVRPDEQDHDEEERGTANVGRTFANSAEYHEETTRLLQSIDHGEASSHGNSRLSSDPEPSVYSSREQEVLSAFETMNALEIAIVSGSKKFLSQKTVQKILNGIWNGDIVFWESMGVHSRKEVRIYNRR